MSHLVRFRSLFAAAALLTASAACNQKSETRQQADRAAEEVKDQVEDLKEESRDLAETARERADDINAIDGVHRPAPIADNGTGDIVDRSVVGERGVDGNSVPASGQPVDRAVDVDRDPETVNEVARYVGDKAEIPEQRVAEGVEDIADDAKAVGENARELANASNEFKYQRMVRIGTLRGVHAVEASQPMLINAFAQSFPLEADDRGEVQEKLVIFQMRLDEAGNAIQSLELVEARDWEDRDDAASKALERVVDAREDVWEELHDADMIGDRTSMR